MTTIIRNQDLFLPHLSLPHQQDPMFTDPYTAFAFAQEILIESRAKQECVPLLDAINNVHTRIAGCLQALSSPDTKAFADNILQDLWQPFIIPLAMPYTAATYSSAIYGALTVLSISPAPTITSRPRSPNLSDDGFRTPKRVCRSATLNPPLSPTTTTQNRFANLQVEQPNDVTVTDMDEDVQPKDPRPESIFVEMTPNWRHTMEKMFSDTEIRLPMKVVNSEFVKIRPDTVEQFRKIQAYLREHPDLKYYTLNIRNERPRKVNIKGLPTDILNQDIKSALTGYNVHEVVQLTKFRTKEPLMQHVKLAPADGWESIYNINELLGFEVQVQSFTSKIKIKQCYSCQKWNHSSEMCTRDPACLKCGKAHHTRTCTKTRDTPATCANCSGPHPANFGGCPANPLNIKKSKQTTPTIKDIFPLIPAAPTHANTWKPPAPVTTNPNYHQEFPSLQRETHAVNSAPTPQAATTSISTNYSAQRLSEPLSGPAALEKTLTLLRDIAATLHSIHVMTTAMNITDLFGFLQQVSGNFMSHLPTPTTTQQRSHPTTNDKPVTLPAQNSDVAK